MEVRRNEKITFRSLQVIIGVWATLLGFIITTVSILLTFTGSKLTEEIKATGHYKTILFSYLLTCFELLIFLLLSLLVLITGVYSGIMVKVLIAGVIISLTDIFICLFFLTMFHFLHENTSEFLLLPEQ